ncbi:MAG: class I SAM-dependent methyltransferase [Saprospiraceae bacterium]|nr:class I SAM-dependent methyltransferase [Saprospiraceae bacterium]
MLFSLNKLTLLPQDLLIKTGPVDHADWNYKKGLLGMIQRQRFKLCLSMMKGSKYKRMLEVGYGSGVFFPELSKYANEIYGIDIHEHHDAVKATLSNNGIHSHLFSGSAEELPFDSDYFDAIVAISALEFIPDLIKACKEISRVITAQGRFYIITPGKSPIVDTGFTLLTGKSVKEDFEDRRQRIIPTLLEFFEIRKHITFPSYGSRIICLYDAFELQKK